MYSEVDVVELMYLHAVRVELADRRDTAIILHFNQATLQCLQLVVDW